jgi:hypothetical protein
MSPSTLKIIERLVFMGLLVLIVLFVGGLIAAGANIRPDNELMYRFIFGVAAALIAFTMGGFVGLEFNGLGLAVRAGGAIAAFLIVFQFAPRVLQSVLPAPDVRMVPPAAVDFRPTTDPTTVGWTQSDLAITLENLSFAQVLGPAQSALLVSERVDLDTGEGLVRLRPAWIVDIRPGATEGGWLGIRGNWGPGLIGPQQMLSRSVMFRPSEPGSFSWAAWLNVIDSAPADERARLRYAVEFAHQTLSFDCTIGMSVLKEYVRKAREARPDRPPIWLEPTCLEVAT